MCYFIIIAIKSIFEFDSLFNYHISRIVSDLIILNRYIDLIITYKIKNIFL